MIAADEAGALVGDFDPGVRDEGCKGAGLKTDLHQTHLMFCTPSCAHRVVDSPFYFEAPHSRQASASSQRRRVLGFEVRVKVNEGLIFLWLVLYNISFCE